MKKLKTKEPWKHNFKKISKKTSDFLGKEEKVSFGED